MQNVPRNEQNDVASRIARETLVRRGADYTDEVRRLLDAGREVMRTGGTAARPRVADIVAAAGLSNEAFYRHFSSKDALVAAILDDGTERLLSYVTHQMAKQSSPEDKIRCWVGCILSQAADEDIAAATLAVLWNAGSLGWAVAAPSLSTGARLGTLLRDPFVELGSDAPELDTELVAHAIVGRLTDLLWRHDRPTPGEVDRLVAFCLAVASVPRVAQHPAQGRNGSTGSAPQLPHHRG